MGRNGKKVQACKLMALNRRTQRRRTEVKQFAFGLIVTGSQPTPMLEMFAFNDIERDWPLNDLYGELRVICGIIKERADQSMKEAFNSIQPGTVISFDGSWEHRRNSKRCLTCVIDQNTQKVVMARIISSKSEDDNFEFCQFAQNMECKAMELMIPILKENKNIVGYVHDNDSKTRKLIKNMGWEVFERIDSGHLLKSFDRKVMTFNKKHNNILNEIQSKLRKYLKALIFESSMTIGEKIGYWNAALDHFCGNHERCPFPHRETEIWTLSNLTEAINLLKKFLESTQYIIECCDPLYSTQVNESFHRIKIKYANKDVKWGFTWEARMCCAILDKNEFNWKLNLYNFLRLPELSISNRLFLEAQEYARISRKQEYHAEKYLNERRIYRKNQKKQNQSKGPILYRPNPYQ